MQTRYIQTCGLNHSWKTTFGRELQKQLSSSIVLDNDEWRLFAQSHYADLYQATKEFQTPEVEDLYTDNMKRFFVQQMISYSLANKVHVIHTACHMYKQQRQSLWARARALWAKTALVYLNIDQEIIFQRASEAGLHKDEALYGKWFMGNLEKMLAHFEYPDSNEVDLYVEVSKPELFATYQQELLEKMRVA